MRNVSDFPCRCRRCETLHLDKMVNTHARLPIGNGGTLASVLDMSRALSSTVGGLAMCVPVGNPGAAMVVQRELLEPVPAP